MFIREERGRQVAKWGGGSISPVGRGWVTWSSGCGGHQGEGSQLETPQGGGGGGRALGGTVMPPATRRGQHSPRKWQPHRESGRRTAGQRLGSLCKDRPKESKLHWGTEAARKPLAGAATQAPHREVKGGGTATASTIADRCWLWGGGRSQGLEGSPELGGKSQPHHCLAVHPWDAPSLSRLQ